MTTQREMPWLSEMRRPQMADAALVNNRRDMLEAVQLCVQLSGEKNEALRQSLSVTKGHFTKIMQGAASLPLRKLPALMRQAGNIAPLQWLAHEMGYELQEVSKTARIAELESLLAKLKDAA